MPHTLTTCTFCGVGCGLYLETDGRRLSGVYPSLSHPGNAGRICVRGWHVHEVTGSPERLHRPLIRGPTGFREATWDEAFSLVAERLQAIAYRHGPEALAFYNSPRCSNEESYLLQKLARAVFQTNNVDHGAGVYAHNSFDVLEAMLGQGASTGSLGDLGRSDVILVDGVDLARQLPTVGGQVLRARLAGTTLIVVDTRRHRIAESADLFLQPRPGTEGTLHAALAKVIVDHGLMNLAFIRERCTGFPEFLDSLAEQDLLGAGAVCGVDPGLIEAAALALGQARAPAYLYSTSGDTRPQATTRALLNLALLTGAVGRDAGGVLALTEHNNLQGACDMGMMPDRLPGHRFITDVGARQAFQRAWSSVVPTAPGHPARDVLADRRGDVHALWLGRYDPIGTACIPEAADALRDFGFVVSQHLFLTPSARQSHVVLPTTAFGEEEVTFTNTDRRIQLARRVVEPQAGLMPAWRQIVEIAVRCGADWNYPTAAAVMDEVASVVPFYAAATHENLSRGYGRQWPCTPDHPLGTPRLFADATAPGRCRFEPLPSPPPAPTMPSNHFTLVAGQSLYYWHRSPLVQHSETLRREHRVLLLDYPENFVEMHTDDARRLGLRDGDRVRVASDLGELTTAARVTPEVRPGTLHVPYFLADAEQELRGISGSAVPFLEVWVEKART